MDKLALGELLPLLLVLSEAVTEEEEDSVRDSDVEEVGDALTVSLDVTVTLLVMLGLTVELDDQLADGV